MDCEKCMKTCVELRRSDGEIHNGHYSILCKKCWGKTYKDGQEDDYIKQNEDGEMIGCCEECQSSNEVLTIWDIEHQFDTVNMVKELEDDGDWNFVYTCNALCEGCNEDLEAEIEAEYQEMTARHEEEEVEDCDCGYTHKPHQDCHKSTYPCWQEDETKWCQECDDAKVNGVCEWKCDEPEEDFNYNWKPIMAKL